MSVEAIKKLRDMTSVGVNDCRKALADSGGDFDKALKILKERGGQMVEKRSGRQTSQGVIEAYLHFGGNLGAMVEVNCETDFVARTEVFKKFAKDVAMQVAAANPIYVKKEDIPEAVLEAAADKNAWIKEHCLLEQVYVKDGKISVAEYLRDIISQTGENVVIRRFSRFALGETNEAAKS